MDYSTRSTRFMDSHLAGRAVCACAATLLAFAATTASAQDAQSGDRVVDPTAARQQAQEIAKGDPPRWYRNDTEQQTLRKEIGAALQEAQNACRQQPASERKTCMQEARATWQRDMAQLRTPGQQ